MRRGVYRRREVREVQEVQEGRPLRCPSYLKQTACGPRWPRSHINIQQPHQTRIKILRARAHTHSRLLRGREPHADDQSVRPHVNIIKLGFVSAATDPLHQSACEEARLSLRSSPLLLPSVFLFFQTASSPVRDTLPLPPVLRRDALHADWIDTSGDSADIRGDERRTVKRPLANTAQGPRLGTAAHAEGKHMFGSRKNKSAEVLTQIVLLCTGTAQECFPTPANRRSTVFKWCGVFLFTFTASICTCLLLLKKCKS